MSERKGTKALELWCRRITDGYPGVKVDNMTTSWRDGLAFCALIHHFRPDLIDFSSLKKEDVYHNNELAFRTAESYLGIPALLDAEDMAQYAVPDRLSILTYLSQYYQHFASTGSSPSRLSGKRSSPSTDRSPLPPSPSSSSPPTKMSTSLGRREPCVSCGQPVFLAQRLLVERRLYHRTCFTCARCGAQLSLASCYQTETDGQYCCETCPDEESDPREDDDINSEETDSVKTGDTSASKGDDRKSDIFKDSERKNAYNRMLSDEEKVRNVQLFKNALAAEDSAFNHSLREHFVQTSTPSSKALSGFLNTQFHHNSDDDEAPALPSSLPPAIVPMKMSPSSMNQFSVSMDLDTYSPTEEFVGKVSQIGVDKNSVDPDSAVRQSVSASEATDSEKFKHFDSEKDVSVVSVDEKLHELSPAGDKAIILETHCAPSTEDKFNHKNKIEITAKTNIEKLDSSSGEIRLRNVNIDETHVNQLITASDSKKENDSKWRNPRDNFDVSAKNADLIAKENQSYVKSDTFEDKKNVDGEISQGTSSPSLVKMRKKLFEQVSPERSRNFDIKVSPVGSRKSTVDQDKLVLTNDKLSVGNNIIISSDSNIVSSTANDKRDISDASIPEIILVNGIKTHAEEESQNSEMNVPCSNSTKSNDVNINSDNEDNKEDNLNHNEANSLDKSAIAVSIKVKEENLVYNNRIDNLEDISGSERRISCDEIMKISGEEVINDVEEKELHSEIMSSKVRDAEKDVTNVAANLSEIQSPIATTDEDVKESVLLENQSLIASTRLTDESVKESDISENQSLIHATEIYDSSIKESDISENQSLIVTTEIYDSSIKESDISENKSSIVSREIHDSCVKESDIPENISARVTTGIYDDSSFKESDLSENQYSVVTTETCDESNKESDLSKNQSTIEVNGEEVEEYPDDLNPFCSDEDDQMPTGVEKKVITPTNRYSLLGHIESTIEVIPSPPQKASTNPFGSCSEDEDETAKPNVAVKKKGEKPPRPPPPVIVINTMKQNTLEMKKIIPAINLNPFDSDDDEISDDDRLNTETPVPTPRQRIGDGQEPHPLPRSSLGSAGPPSFHGSSSSLSSTISRRKKAPAPKPPASSIFDAPVAAPRTNLKAEDVHETSLGSTLSSHNSSLLTSPQLSPRSRKRRPAPAPPTACSTFIDSPSLDYQTLNVSGPIPPRLAVVADELEAFSPIVGSAEDNKSMISLSSVRRIISAVEFDDPDPEMICSEDWDKEKLDKEEKNNSLQTNDNKVLSQSYENKSTSGMWKRRKGPAPAVPLLQRRTPAQPLSAAAIRRELTLLEEQQRGLEKQGVRLEEIIRERAEGMPEGTSDPETDELVLQLFELVNEKNELFRRQAELMYIRRQQRLEEEHADLEHQLRCMMARPEANKTDADKAREEQLLQRLLLVVTRRDEVVSALEAERVRERREDQAIRERMVAHRAKLDENSSMSSADSHASAAKKEKKKEKKKWMKRDKLKKSEDKNVSEETESTTVKKEKKTKKWF